MLLSHVSTAVKTGQCIAAKQASLELLLIRIRSCHSAICTSCAFGRNHQISGPPSTCSCCAGGYLQYIFRTAARELFGIEVPWSEPLPLKVLRNADFQEVSLERDGHAVLRFALAYGFRNIQTIVSRAPSEAPALFPASLGSSTCLWEVHLSCVGALRPDLSPAYPVAHHCRSCL